MSDLAKEETQRMKTIGFKEFEKAYDSENWVKARVLIKPLLRAHPQDHWLLTRLSSIYHEERKYGLALKKVEAARALCPQCPLVLWDYAGTLYSIDRQVEAIEVWKSLLRRGVHSVGYGECGEGKVWARSLLADCSYRIGKAYLDLGKRALGIKYLKAYIREKQAGAKSIYSLREIKAELAAALRTD